MNIVDCHTHHPHAGAHAVLNVSPRDFSPEAGRYYSVGIHPWDTAAIGDNDYELLSRAAQHPQVLALGETGFDALRGASLNEQGRVFDRHIALSEALGKPLIIHCVKAAHLVLERWNKQASQRVPWVIHGFRGNPRLARQLLNAGLFLSLGHRFNPLTARLIPAERLLLETDDAPVTIDEVAALITAAREGSESGEGRTWPGTGAHHVFGVGEL